jgi:drug/metabolite transporter (DMT)-like permease
MFALSVFLVACSGLAHAVWNLFAKSSEDKAVFLWIIFMPSTIALLPVLIVEAGRTSFTEGEYGMLLFSLLLQGAYAWLLSLTYKKGDLSQVYPIMRGTSTLLIPLLGVLFMGEHLPIWGWTGIFFMIVGFLIMGGWLKREHSQPDSYQPVLLALSVGLLITCYTLVDKWNLQIMSPLALLEVTNIGFVLGLTPSVWINKRAVGKLICSHWRSIAIGSVLSPGSYLLFLFAIQDVQVASTAPLRETSIVFGTILGLFVLKEDFPARRLAASAVVLTGIFLIAFLGR